MLCCKCCIFVNIYCWGTLVVDILYCIGGSDSYLQFRSSEKVIDLMYGRAVMCEVNPYVIVILFSLCRCGIVFLLCDSISQTVY